MTAALAGRSPPSVYRIVIVPHRSLGRKGFRILMGALVAVNAVVGVYFYAKGAWPVIAFCGLDVAAVWLAFKLNYRGGAAREVIEIDEQELALTRTSPTGRRERFSINPYWARVVLSERPDGRTAIAIASHGRRLSFGALLTDDERRELAADLEAELSRRRRSA